MTRSFSHYTDGDQVYLIRKLKIFAEAQKIAAFGGAHRRVGAAEGCDLLIFIFTAK
jgi:hypothetical protein